MPDCGARLPILGAPFSPSVGRVANPICQVEMPFHLQPTTTMVIFPICGGIATCFKTGRLCQTCLTTKTTSTATNEPNTGQSRWVRICVCDATHGPITLQLHPFSTVCPTMGRSLQTSYQEAPLHPFSTACPIVGRECPFLGHRPPCNKRLRPQQFTATGATRTTITTIAITTSTATNDL